MALVKTYKIEVLGEPNTSIFFSDQKTLLDAIKSKNIDVHYHCKEGFCGACRTKLIDGQVEYKTDPLAFIDDDEILVCCCIPSSNLSIKLY